MADGDPHDEGPQRAPLTEPTDKVRETAKWLIGVFGAIGALIVARIQLSDLGTLSGADLWSALFAIALAVLGICLATSGVANLLLPRQRTVRELMQAPHADPGIIFFRENPEAIRGYNSLGALFDAWQQDLTAYKTAFQAWRINPTAHHRNRLRLTGERLRPLEVAVRSALQIATYQSLRADYRRMLQNRLFPGIILTAAGIVWFSIASSSPASDISLDDTDLRGAILDGVSFRNDSLRKSNLSEASLRNVDFSNSDLSGADLSGADLTGANLKGAATTNAEFSAVTWEGTTCPDGAVSNEVGGSCEAHLESE